MPACLATRAAVPTDASGLVTRTPNGSSTAGPGRRAGGSPRGRRPGDQDGHRPWTSGQCFEGSTDARTSRATFLMMLPRSGSRGTDMANFFAWSRVMCGGSGGTFGSV